MLYDQNRRCCAGESMLDTQVFEQRILIKVNNKLIEYVKEKLDASIVIPVSTNFSIIEWVRHCDAFGEERDIEIECKGLLNLYPYQYQIIWAKSVF